MEPGSKGGGVCGVGFSTLPDAELPAWLAACLRAGHRSYPKLGGMTGTAATEAAEFSNIYNLPVTVGAGVHYSFTLACPWTWHFSIT